MSIRSRFGAALLRLAVKAAGDAGWAMTLGRLELLRDAFARPSKTGKAVNEESAIYVTMVLATVMRISFGVAQVPWKVFRVRPNGRGKDEARDHPLWRLLHRKPNEWQTSFQFRVTLMLHLLLAGRFVGFINRVDGKIVEIIPLVPKRITIERKRGTYDLQFIMSGDDGTRREVPAEMIWHLAGPSWDGWQGLEWVKLAREAIGLAMTAEENQAETQARGGKIPGVLAMEGNVKKEAYADLSEWIRNQAQKDIAETGVMMIDHNAKFFPSSQTGVEAQTLETRRFQGEEICRHWGLFPIMIGLGDKTQSFASVEQMLMAHEVHTLDPHMVNIEQSAEVTLLDQETEGDISIVFVRAGLRRAAMKDQFEGFATALGRGATAKGQAFMTPNEVRDFLEMNPIAGGDELSDPTAGKPAPTEIPPAPGGGQQ
jgi:HK97 family phage portal protein